MRYNLKTYIGTVYPLIVNETYVLSYKEDKKHHDDEGEQTDFRNQEAFRFNLTHLAVAYLKFFHFIPIFFRPHDKH